MFRVEIIGPPIEKPSTLRSLAARDMPYATFAGAWMSPQSALQADLFFKISPFCATQLCFFT